MTTINSADVKKLFIGKQGENLATRVSFAWFKDKCRAEFGEGVLTLAHQRQEDPAPYLVALVDGTEWDITAADVAHHGTGLAELIYTVDNVVKKSLRWVTVTLSALGAEAEVPPEWQSYIDRVLAAVASVEGVIVAEAERVAAENARKIAETARENAEHVRAEAEAIRETRYTEAVRAENARQTAEAERIANENARQTAESTRAANETQRAQTFAGYAAAESARNSAEAERIASETERKAAEVNRISGERQREQNELARISAENARKTAENARVQAESMRNTAESDRGVNEARRAASETQRETAERARQTAESARESAETQRETDSAAAIQNANTAAANANEAAEEARKFAGDVEIIKGEVGSLKTDFNHLDTRVTTLENEPKVPEDLIERVDNIDNRVTQLEGIEGLRRYGVTGIGLSNPKLTRLYDAVDMVAQVGTDGDNPNVVNDFDDVAPFNRKKCVGEWRLNAGKPVYHVNAYYGDPDYTEDGSMGDYVAVDCTPAYYKFDGTELIISAHHYDGYRPFDCLMDRETNECRPHTYLPCYALAVKDGHAVSLPDLRNEQGDYKKLFDTCKTAANDAASQAILMPIAVNFYEWALFTVEFATTNCQSVMQGCASLRHNNDDMIIMSSATEGIIQNHQAARVEGEYVSIQPSNVDINTYTWLASHRIVSIERCNQDGTPNASGAYNHVILDVIDDTREIVSGTTYRFAARPYNTGACNGVSTPSGSPVSNANGYYPMKYRWRENVYGNQYQTVSDLMDYAVLEDGFANVNANYAAHLEWYYHRNPERLTPTNYANSTAGRDAMIAAGWELLDVSTPAENYISGYVKSRDHSKKYPDVWKPGITAGASASTYFADYASLVSSNVLRAVRVGGYWSNGSIDGFSLVNAIYAPSYGNATYGGGLYYPQ